MIEIDLTQINSVRLHWDWTIAILPREAIFRLAYEPTSDGIDNKVVVLEMDLAYLQSQHCVWLEEGKPETEENILEAVKEKNIWELELQEKGRERRFVALPTNRKSNYYEEKIWAIEWDAPNLCEHHTSQANRYTIEWKMASQEDLAMQANEWEIFCKKGNLCQLEMNRIYLGMEFLDRILVANNREDAVWKRVEQLSTGEITFPDYTEMLSNTRQKIHQKNHATGELLGLKRDYQVTQTTENIQGQEVTILNARNHAHHWNLNWICVSDLENEETKQRLEQVILAGEANEDTTNYFSRTIFVVEDSKQMAEWLLAFYRKIYGTKSKITGEKILVVSTEELNQYWYEFHEKWRIL